MCAWTSVNGSTALPEHGGLSLRTQPLDDLSVLVGDDEWNAGVVQRFGDVPANSAVADQNHLICEVLALGGLRQCS